MAGARVRVAKENKSQPNNNKDVEKWKEEEEEKTNRVTTTGKCVIKEEAGHRRKRKWNEILFISNLNSIVDKNKER